MDNFGVLKIDITVVGIPMVVGFIRHNGMQKRR